MTTEQAIKILKHHNRWRRGEEKEIDMLDTADIGMAIDTAIRVMQSALKKEKA